MWIGWPFREGVRGWSQTFYYAEGGNKSFRYALDLLILIK